VLLIEAQSAKNVVLINTIMPRPLFLKTRINPLPPQVLAQARHAIAQP